MHERSVKHGPFWIDFRPGRPGSGGLFQAECYLHSRPGVHCQKSISVSKYESEAALIRDLRGWLNRAMDEQNIYDKVTHCAQPVGAPPNQSQEVLIQEAESFDWESSARRVESSL